jgi:hypothetical protein
MRKPSIALALSLVLGVALVASAAFARKAPKSATGSFTPPPEPGIIYTVIDFARAGGRAEGTVVEVSQGAVNRTVTVAAPYTGTCAETTPSGFVLKLRHPRPDSVPLTISTDGTIVRGPYQGDVPMELLSACYRVVS